MPFAPDAIAYYTLHIVSLLLSVILIVAFWRNNQHPTIAYYALTLAVASVVFVLSIAQGDNENAARGSALCTFQGISVIYVLSAMALWLLLIAFNLWVLFYRRRYNMCQLRIWYMAIGWGLPVFPAGAAAVLALPRHDKGTEPWRYFCIASQPSTTPTLLYLLLLICMAGTLLLSVTNVVAMRQYLKGMREGVHILDRGLCIRIMVVGFLTAFVLLISSAQRFENVTFAANLGLKGDWPDFLTVVPAYLAFLVFGTSDEARKYWAPRWLPVPFSDRSSSVLDQFSIVNPTSTHVSEPQNVATHTRHKLGGTSTSRFSVQGEPHLTINVDAIGSKNKGKGKQRSSVRRSVTSIFMNYSNINKVGTAVAFPPAARTRHTIAHEANRPRTHKGKGTSATPQRQTVHVPTPDMQDDRFLKSFSFEYRKTKVIIELPEELLYRSDSDTDSTYSTDGENSVDTQEEESKPFAAISRRIARLSQLDLPSVPMIKEHAATPDSGSTACRTRCPIPPPLTIPVKPPATSTGSSSRSQQGLKGKPSFSFLAKDPSVSPIESAAAAAALPHTPSFGDSSRHDDRGFRRSTLSSRSFHSTRSNTGERDSPTEHRYSSGLSLTPRASQPISSMNLPSPRTFTTVPDEMTNEDV